jgi:hypothetical protein
MKTYKILISIIIAFGLFAIGYQLYTREKQQKLHSEEWQYKWDIKSYPTLINREGLPLLVIKPDVILYINHWYENGSEKVIGADTAYLYPYKNKLTINP